MGNDMKKFLHVGCGQSRKDNTTRAFNTDLWEEIRFDIDPACTPDIIGTIVDMSALSAGSVDAIFSSHNIEHIYAHEVPLALKEFLRVLLDDGFLVLTCPDLQSVCAAVADGRLVETLYVSPAGPIAAFDILYGHRPQVAGGATYMAHKCGFTYPVLCQTLLENGFRTVWGGARPQAFDLWVVASKNQRSEADIYQLAKQHLPVG